jgi:hypothetical protein
VAPGQRGDLLVVDVDGRLLEIYAAGQPVEPATD